MVRKLIALLFLLTGLAAMSQPAHARIVDVDRVGTMFSASSTCVVQAGAQEAHMRGSLQGDAVQRKACPKPPKIVVIVTTVMLKIDRSRE